MAEGAFKPAAVKCLALVVERHCARFNIVSTDARDEVAMRAIVLYENGVTAEDEMLARLAERYVGDPSVTCHEN